MGQCGTLDNNGTNPSPAILTFPWSLEISTNGAITDIKGFKAVLCQRLHQVAVSQAAEVAGIILRTKYRILRRFFCYGNLNLSPVRNS